MPFCSQARTVIITSTKALPAADPRHQRALGAHRLCQPRGVLRADFLSVVGFKSDALQNDAGKIQIAAVRLVTDSYTRG